MHNSAFILPEALSRALAGETGGLSFSSATWGVRFPEVDNLATLPAGAKLVGVGKAPINLDGLRRANQLVAIKTLSTTAEIINELPYLPNLRMAFLITVKVPEAELRALAGCKKLEHLALYDAKKITGLGFLANIPRLRSLYLSSLPKLDFSTLPAITSLREFVFDGGFNQAVKVPTLEPIARLNRLLRLELFNIEAGDGSLAPLANLKRLAHLFISARAFEVEQFAQLAASLPKTQGAGANCLKPLFKEPNLESPERADLPCPRCSRSRVLLTGKGTPVSCLVCDAKRIEKHIARWQAARKPF